MVCTAVCLAAGKLCKLCGGSDRSFFLHYGKVSRSWHWTRIHLDIIPRVHLMFSLVSHSGETERERERENSPSTLCDSHFRLLIPGFEDINVYFTDRVLILKTLSRPMEKKNDV